MEEKLKESNVLAQTIDGRHFVVIETETLDRAIDMKKVILKSINNSYEMLEIIEKKLPELEKESERLANGGQMSIAGSCAVSAEIETLEFVKNILTKNVESDNHLKTEVP